MRGGPLAPTIRRRVGGLALRRSTAGSRLTRRKELVDRGDRDLAEPADVDRADLAGGDELVELAATDPQNRGRFHDAEDAASGLGSGAWPT